MQAFNNPPAMTSSPSCETWKTETKMWEKPTDLPAIKTAPANDLTLSGRAREAFMTPDVD